MTGLLLTKPIHFSVNKAQCILRAANFHKLAYAKFNILVDLHSNCLHGP